MNRKKYALGMGDVDHLNDGEFDTIDEAHAEALRLAPLPHDNGDYHSTYMIGRIVPASTLATHDICSALDSVVDLMCEHLIDNEIYTFMSDDIPTIDGEGRAKLLAAMKDVLRNNTTYPNAHVVHKVKTYSTKA